MSKQKMNAEIEEYRSPRYVWRAVRVIAMGYASAVVVGAVLLRLMGVW